MHLLGVLLLSAPASLNSANRRKQLSTGAPVQAAPLRWTVSSVVATHRPAHLGTEQGWELRLSLVSIVPLCWESPVSASVPSVTQSCGENQQSRTETEKRSLNCQRESNPLGYHSSQLEDAKWLELAAFTAVVYSWSHVGLTNFYSVDVCCHQKSGQPKLISSGKLTILKILHGMEQ